MVAAVISGILGETSDAILILIIVVLNAIIGVVQENKAEDAMEALKNLTIPEAKVIRDGAQTIIPSVDLVPGDLVVLDAGDYVPADGRLIEAATLQIQESALTGESVLAVAAIPEGLPAIVTVVLAMGTQKLIAKHAIIRKLPAVETLGCASVICSDKTGTLTQNKMTIRKVYANEGIVDADNILDDGFTESEKFVVRIGQLCNDASITYNGEETLEIGDPTEVAMVAYAKVLGYEKEQSMMQAPRVGEIPFDSDRKLMTTVHEYVNTWVSFTKGAPDVLLGRCNEYLKGYEVLPLDDAARQEILQANETLSDDAFRVLGYAFQQHPENPEVTMENLENNLIFAGLRVLWWP